MRYDSQPDVNMRLSNSIIRFKGIPYYARLSDDKELHVHLFSLDNVGGKPVIRNVHSSDENLDISAVPLGYVNSRDSDFPVYISRHCYRHQKQGLDNQNAITVFVADNEKEIKEIPGIRVDMRYLYPTILGDYPPVNLPEMLKANAAYGKAFHRKFALTTSGKGIVKLKYLWYTAGFILEEGVVNLIYPYNIKTIQSTLERESRGLFEECSFVHQESIASEDWKAFEQA